MQPTAEASVLADFDNTRFRGNGVDLRFQRSEAGGFEVAGRDAQGEAGIFNVAYTFGVEPLQQYLLEMPGGRLQALNVAWDTRPASDGGQRWFHLYPDEQTPPGDQLHWDSPDMNWNYMCAECHSTDLQKNYDPVARTFDTQWTDANVSCEACHSPGSNHVRWAEAQRDGNELVFSAEMGLEIDLDPGDREWRIDESTGLAERFPQLERNTQVEGCARCHARRSTQAEYAHGKDLSETHRIALLDENLYFPDGQIRDEVYVYGSFLQSKMYSSGVTCSDCHQPHSGEVLVDGNGLCNQCHLADKFDVPDHTRHDVGTEGALCANCHMPERTYMVLDDRRDHSFKVPRPDHSVAFGTPNACTSCHTNQSDTWAASTVAEWFPDSTTRTSGFTEALAAGRSRAPDAARQLRDLADNWEQPAIARATALTLLETYPEALTLDSIGRGLSNGNSLIRAAAVGALRTYDSGTQVRMAYPLLRDRNLSVRLQAARVLVNVPLNEVPDVERATILAGVHELIEALAVNAERAEFQLNIGFLYAATGRAAEAEAAYRLAISLAPNDVAARVNLADMYRAQARDAEGEPLLREAVALAPDNADVRHALGLNLIRRNQRVEAAQELERAWRLAPDNAGYGVAYALALDSGGDLAGAWTVLQEVERRHPTDPRVLSSLVQAARKGGNGSAALEYARRLLEILPNDRGVQQLVSELEAAQGAP